MTELSVFVDESGDFGEYEKHAPYYLHWSTATSNVARLIIEDGGCLLDR